MQLKVISYLCTSAELRILNQLVFRKAQSLTTDVFDFFKLLQVDNRPNRPECITERHS